MAPDIVIALLAAGCLTTLLALMFADELRRRRFRASEHKDNVFRCVRCALVYTDDFDVKRSRCPQCGKTNEVVVF
jgi:rubrerythrin